MIRTLVFGATGYTGIELVRILSQHPESKLSAVVLEVVRKDGWRGFSIHLWG